VALLGLLLLAQALAAGAIEAGGYEHPPRSFRIDCEGLVPDAGRSLREEGGGQTTGRDISFALPPAFLRSITPDRISAVIEKLQSFGTRYQYTERANDAAAYLASEFGALNLTVQRQDFFYNGFTMTNVLAILPGQNASLPALVLGAHYDSLNGTDSLLNSYAPAPGADDDASGVAAVLAIAGAFSRAGTERTVIFAAFAAEEIGHVGSNEFVRGAQLQAPGLYAGLCFDMIGYNHRYPKVDLVCNNASQWLCEAVIETNRKNAIGVGAETVVTPDNPQNWSDQVSFWEAGLPAMYFIEDENPTRNSSYFQANPYYHTGRDTLDKLNLTLMTKVARLGAATAAALAGLALPDFRTSEGGMPGGIIEGSTFSISVLLANLGAPGSYEFNVTLEVDGVPVDRRAGAPDMWVVLKWNATRGRHLLSLVVDSDDRYIEWNETNNRFTFSLDIPARPDLRVAGFWATDNAPVPGRVVSLVVLLENAGGPVESAHLVIYQGDGSDGLLLDRPVNVAPGDVAAVVQDITAPESPVNLTAEIRDVSPPENVTDNDRMTLTLAPDVLNREDYRIVIEPDVVQTYENVEVSIEGAPAGFDWFIDFGDGHFAGWTGAPYSHVYTRSGTYFVGATLRDTKGAIVALEAMPVSVRDRPPVAVLEGPAASSPGQPVDFSASRSHDADGEIVQYLWDFGEGAKVFGPDARHAFALERTYPVRLTVTDDRGQTNTTVLLLEVRDLPPVAKASADRKLLFAGGNVMFDGTASVDADGSVTSYLWDLGDGASSTAALASHAYPKAGEYMVTLTVTDDRGATTSATMNVTVLKKAMPLEASSGTVSPAVLPAMIIVMFLIAIVLMLRGWSAPVKTGRTEPDDDEEG